MIEVIKNGLGKNTSLIKDALLLKKFKAFSKTDYDFFDDKKDAELWCENNNGFKEKISIVDVAI